MPFNTAGASESVEDQHALYQGSESSVVCGVADMSRYPFMAAANEYLEAVKNTHQVATVVELRRRLKRMARDFETLKVRGIIENDDPRLLGEKEILAYLGLLRARGMKESGLAHNFSTLRQLLISCENSALDKMRIKFGGQLPKRRTKRMAPLGEKQVQAILVASMSAKDWRALQAYALVVTAIFTGARTKELRLAKVGDLDHDEWNLAVRHPKGEGTWGDERRTPVLPQARPLLIRYLRERNRLVSERAPLNEALFPALSDKGDGYFSTNGLVKLKNVVQAGVGIKLDLRTCRRTFGQLLLDRGASIESVSVLMGHDTTKTTESYYCRMKEERALAEVSNLW